ncbi:hypothetical protein LVJ94_35245 [Pendulispora rubella]|uniref:Uncharacterized protein n=1 Tax=Pendulispora rubella TaxID=2741070 RepID=A0ABZ2KXX2_9BACT
MDRDAILLSGFARRLGAWVRTIERATGASNVDVSVSQAGLLIAATWAAGPRVDRPFAKTLATTELLGATLNGAHYVTCRPCDVARGFIREVLDAQGVLDP